MTANPNLATVARYNDKRWGVRVRNQWVDPLSCLYADRAEAQEHADLINSALLGSWDAIRDARGAEVTLARWHSDDEAAQ